MESYVRQKSGFLAKSGENLVGAGKASVFDSPHTTCGNLVTRGSSSGFDKSAETHVSGEDGGGSGGRG